MKIVLLALVCCVLLFAGSCAFLDKATGYDPETGEKIGLGVAEYVAPVAPMVGPWGEVGVGALGVLSSLYILLRGKKYKKAALSGVKGVEAVIEALADKKITRDEINAILKKIQAEDGTRDVVKKIIETNKLT